MSDSLKADVKDLIDGIVGLVGLSPSEANQFRERIKYCKPIAATAAAGMAVKGVPLITGGSMTLPGLGTVAGATGYLVLVAGTAAVSYGTCMGVLEMAQSLYNKLLTDHQARAEIKRDIRAILQADPSRHLAA